MRPPLLGINPVSPLCSQGSRRGIKYRRGHLSSEEPLVPCNTPRVTPGAEPSPTDLMQRAGRHCRHPTGIFRLPGERDFRPDFFHDALTALSPLCLCPLRGSRSHFSALLLRALDRGNSYSIRLDQTYRESRHSDDPRLGAVGTEGAAAAVRWESGPGRAVG